LRHPVPEATNKQRSGGRDGRDIARVQAVVRRLERHTRVVRKHDAGALGREQQRVRLRSIERDGVDRKVIQMRPMRARIDGTKQAVSGSGEHSRGFAGSFGNDVRAARGVGDAVEHAPVESGILRTINSAAGAGEQTRGARGADAQGEDVGVVQHAVVNRDPGGSAVCGFPRQMRRARIENACVGAIERQRDDIFQIGMALRCNAAPTGSAVVRHIQTAARAGGHGRRISGKDRERFHGQPRQVLPPSRSRIARLPQSIAGRVLSGDCRPIVRTGGGIDRQHVHIAEQLASERNLMPGGRVILRAEQLASACARQDYRRIVRIHGERNDAAAKGTPRLPIRSGQRCGKGEQKSGANKQELPAARSS
jgi:hypothetical protein